MAKKTDAEKKAQAKYDKSHKEQFKSYYLKYGLTDPDNQKIVVKLDKVPNKHLIFRESWCTQERVIRFSMLGG